MKAFYSWVFDNADKQIKPQHISLYLFLLNQNNRANWIKWFKCPYDLAMQGACIGNKKTYYNCLRDLEEWKLIQYKKGVNEWKAPLIYIEVLKCTSSVPQSEPQDVPQGVPLPTPQGTQNNKPITDNKEKDIYVNSDVDSVYKQYPTKCPVNSRALSKSQKDKNKIKTLLKKHTAEELIKIIQTYIEECKRSKTYVKNFSTFLNNLPDYDEQDSYGRKTITTKQERENIEKYRNIKYEERSDGI